MDLDHFIVPAREKTTSAKLRANLLGVRWALPEPGFFAAVYVTPSLTLDKPGGQQWEILTKSYARADLGE